MKRVHRVPDKVLLHVKGVDIKYIDPTYMIRAVPTNPNDRIYCKVRLGSPAPDWVCNSEICLFCTRVCMG